MPASAPTLLRWSEHGLLALAARAPPRALLAADSFLVDQGHVRGYHLHWERLTTWAGALGIDDLELTGFRTAVTSALPRTGRFFPRVEIADGNQLQLRLRPAGKGEREARVIVGQPGDPRTRPTWKGPDVDLLHALRAEAVAAGADELILRDAEGSLVEGVFDSLLWWEDDVLCTTPEDRTLPGVTRVLLLRIAAERGVQVRVRSPLPAELAVARRG